MYSEFEIWKMCDTSETETLVDECDYPPRFRIECTKGSICTSLNVCFNLYKKLNNCDNSERFGILSLDKCVTDTRDTITGIYTSCI